MNTSTRRGILTSALVLLGASSFYSLSRPADEPERRDPRRTTTGNVDPTTPTETTRSADPSGYAVHVGPDVPSLPDAPDTPAFGLTRNGVYEFRGDGDGWQHVRLGSITDPVPFLEAAQASVGTTPTGRPVISNGNRTIYVDPRDGDDSAAGTRSAPVKTIQEAVWRVPLYLRHQYTVDLATVPSTPIAYDEDVLVPAFVGTGSAGQEKQAAKPGPFLNLVIRGKQSEPSAVDVGSLMFGNVVGTAAGNLYYATISRTSPFDDEGYGLSAYGNGEVKLFDVRFADGPKHGLLVYGARAKVSNVDFGNGNVDIGLKAKRHASAVVHDSRGEAGMDAYRATSNSKISIVDGATLSGSPQFNTLRGGLIYDGGQDGWVGLSGNASVENERTPPDVSTDGVVRRVDHPDDPKPGTIWYVDGSDDVEEGFYGERETGTVRLG